MRVQGNKYRCEWCGLVFNKEIKKYTSGDSLSKGKSNVSDQCVCPNCNRYVSQKIQ